MLGNPGSNPIELFWDVVDGLDQALDAKIILVEDAIKRYNEKAPKDGNGESVVFTVKPETTWEQFSSIVKAEADSAVNALTEEELGTIFKAVCLSAFQISKAKVTYSWNKMLLRSWRKRRRSWSVDSVICRMTCATR